MTSTLLENSKQQLTPAMIQHLSSFLDETPAHTQTAVGTSIATVLAGLLHLSSSGAGPIQLLSLVNQANDGSLLNNLSGLLEGGGHTTQNLMTAGREILSTLFAGTLSTVSELIATTSSVTNASASALLSITAPVVVGVLGRVRTRQGLNAVRLATLLMGQKEDIVQLAPGGLVNVFGLNSIADLGVRRTSAAAENLKPATRRHMVTAPLQAESTLKKWGWPVLAVVAIGLIYFFMSRGGEVAQAPLATPVSAAPSVAPLVTLPDGTALALTEGSLNYNVAAFLKDPALSTTPKTFIFDHVHFDPGTATLTAESQQTVKDLGAILKAYPTSDVRLDGYTDNVGDATANQTLSLDRAAAVREALIEGGVDATRITTAGYGQQNPLAYNGTEEGRAKNQRLELAVVKK